MVNSMAMWMFAESARLEPGGPVHLFQGAWGHKKTLCGKRDTGHWTVVAYSQEELCRGCQAVVDRLKRQDAEEIALRKKMSEMAKERAEKARQENKLKKLQAATAKRRAAKAAAEAALKKSEQREKGKIKHGTKNLKQTGASTKDPISDQIREQPKSRSLCQMAVVDDPKENGFSSKFNHLSLEPKALQSEIGMEVQEPSYDDPNQEQES